MEPPFKYWAFISYSHRDRRWAEWLRRSVESYPIPRRLVGTEGRFGPVPRQLFPVYRDRDESAASSDLAEHVRHALDQSANLVVVCSPNAVESRWVNEEILTFKRMGREDHIFAFIVAGEPGATGKAAGGGGEAAKECFPPALRFALGPDGTLSGQAVEPTAADARRQGDGRGDALARLVGGLLGVGFDDLRQRARLRQRLRFWRGIFLALAGAVATALGIWALIAGQIAASHRAAEQAWGAYAGGDYHNALNYVADGLPAGEGLRPDLTSAKALAVANMALYQNRRVYGLQLVSAFAVSGDRRLAAAAEAREATIWDLKSGVLLHRFTLQDDPTSWGLALAARTQKLATVDGKGVVHLVDIATANDLRLSYKSRFAAAANLNRSGIDVPGRPVFSADERRMVFVDNAVLVLVDAASGHVIAVSAGLGEKLLWAGFAADGRSVLAIGESGSWRWAANTGVPQRLQTFDAKALSSVPSALQPQTAVLLRAGKVQVIDIVTGRILRALDVTKTAKLASLAPDGTVVALDTDGDADIYARSVTSARRIHTTAKDAESLLALGGGRFATLIAPGYWRTAEVWDYAHPLYLGTLPSVDGALSRFMFWKGRLLTFSKSGILRLWDPGKRIDKGVLLTLHSVAGVADPWLAGFSARPLAISGDGNRILMGFGKELFLWRADTGALLARWSTKDTLRGVWLSPDGSVAATQGYAQPVVFWALPQHRYIAAVQQDAKPEHVERWDYYLFVDIDRLAISPNGKYAAIACARCEPDGGKGVALFDIRGGRRIAAPLAGEVKSVAFRDDNEVLVRHEGRIDAFDRAGMRLWSMNSSETPDVFAQIDLVENPFGSPGYGWGLEIGDGPSSDRARALFTDTNASLAPISISDYVHGEQVDGLGVAALPAVNGVSFWRVPPVRSARQLVQAICAEAGTAAPSACSREEPLHTVLVLKIVAVAIAVLAFLALLMAPFVWLSALVWRGSWRNLFGRGAFLAALLGVGVALLGSGPAFATYFLLLLLIVIPGLLLAALRTGIVSLWRRMIRP
jgi:hypothetical protein